MLRNYFRASLDTQTGKNLPAVQETSIQFLGWKKSPGKGNGYPLQYFCWKIPLTEEPGGLQSTGSQRVGHNWVTKTFFKELFNSKVWTDNKLPNSTEKKKRFSPYLNLYDLIFYPQFFILHSRKHVYVQVSSYQKKIFNLCFILSLSFSSSRTNVYSRTHTHHTSSKWQLQSKSLQSPKCGQDK